MDADAPHRVPSGILANEWADVPLARIVAWKTLVLLFWLVIGSLAFGGRPRTMTGVALLVAAVLLVAVPWAWAKRRFGNPVFHNPLARRLALRTDQAASGARVAYLLVAFALAGVVYAAIIAVVWLIAPYFAPVKSFVGRHIY
jgi:hypothetical protein